MSNYPIKITAGKIIDLSLVTFTNVRMKTLNSCTFFAHLFTFVCICLHLLLDYKDCSELHEYATTNYLRLLLRFFKRLMKYYTIHAVSKK